MGCKQYQITLSLREVTEGHEDMRGEVTEGQYESENEPMTILAFCQTSHDFSVYFR